MHKTNDWIFRNTALLALTFATFFSACATSSKVLPYANLDQYVGVPDVVSLTGYISAGQETVGLYPRQSLRLNRDEQCVYIHPSILEANDLSYGQRVTITGRISRTWCHEPNTVCFQMCDTYSYDVMDVQLMR